MSLRHRCNVDLAERVLLFKSTIKRWFYYASLKYLQTHNLSDDQEIFLSEITDCYLRYMDKIESDSDFLKEVKLPPVNPVKRVR